jgi:hypothetical protein
MAGRSTDTASAYKGVAVTPADNTRINTTRAIYVGGAGNLVVKFADVTDPTAAGNTVTLTGVLAGQVYPIQVNCVMSTSTTATSIVALY